MTRETRKSVSRGGKRSKRSVRPRQMTTNTDHISLNPVEEEIVNEEKRDMVDEPIETNQETSQDSIEKVDTMVKINEIPNDEVKEENNSKEESREEDTKESVVNPPPPVNHQPSSAFQRVFPNTTPVTDVKKQKSSSSTLSMLQNPIIKYSMIGLGVLMFYFIFLRSSGKKTDASGPTIVDVTGSDNSDKKSVKNSINRVSSPRIVFGDLRKNPSLMVAPPMTPLVN